MATSSNENEPSKLEGFDLDALDDFLNGIQAVADEVGAKSTKTIKCFFCKDVLEVPLSYRLDETCPPCLETMRFEYLDRKGNPWGF